MPSNPYAKQAGGMAARWRREQAEIEAKEAELRSTTPKLEAAAEEEATEPEPVKEPVKKAETNKATKKAVKKKE